MTEDRDLLERYRLSRDEEAFTTLVDRYLSLVYSIAFGQLGETELAKDVAQEVFLDLARKGPKLKEAQALGGWLYQHTMFVSSKARRSDQRRKIREAKMENAQADPAETAPLSEVIIETMQALTTADRDALILRFLESRSLKEIGQALDCTEEAARKRVDRALDRLREALSSKGIASTSGTIGSVLVASVIAAPVGLKAAIASSAFAASATVPITFTLLEFMNAKLKTAIITGLVAAGITAPVLMQRKISRLEGQLETPRPSTTSPTRNEVVGSGANVQGAEHPTLDHGTAGIVWSEVQSDDYGRYMANLRRIGCSEETIKDIIGAKVRRDFAEKRKASAAFTERIPYWETGVQLRKVAQERLKAIDEQLATQEKAVMTSLFGEDPAFHREPKTYRRVDLDNEILRAVVPAAKFEQLKSVRFEIEGYFDEHILPRTNIKGEDGFNDQDREVYVAFRQMEREKMAAVLTPEQLIDVELHTHYLAHLLRYGFEGFDFSEQEFRQLYQALRDYETIVDPYYFGGSDALMAQQMKARNAIDGKVAELIGPTRFAAGHSTRMEARAAPTPLGPFGYVSGKTGP